MSSALIIGTIAVNMSMFAAVAVYTDSKYTARRRGSIKYRRRRCSKKDSNFKRKENI